LCRLDNKVFSNIKLRFVVEHLCSIVLLDDGASIIKRNSRLLCKRNQGKAWGEERREALYFLGRLTYAGGLPAYDGACVGYFRHDLGIDGFLVGPGEVVDITGLIV
jgi:hypothetical protein